MAYFRTFRIFAGLSTLALTWVSACGSDGGGSGGGSGGSGGGEDAAAGSGGEPDAGGGGASGSSGSSSSGGSSGSGGASNTGGAEADASMDGSNASDAGGECADGCECDLDSVCNWTCAAGCMVECLGGTCTGSCPEGDCAMDADFGANATYSCEGGGCEVDCDNDSICQMDCSGGGCNVVCDAGSTCQVTCGGSATCTLTCASGGRGICEGDHCETVDCDATCEPDPSYQPELDPSDFTNVVDNPLFPLPVGARWEYDGIDEKITITVTDMEKTVMGIDVVVVHDEVRTPEGELVEDTLDWYAQDGDGNVWYMGEETAEYVNGEIATTEGSWEAGVDGAFAGIIMKASPMEGDLYRQEYLACEAEDMGEVVAVGVEEGDHTDCIRIRDFTPLDSLSNEIKTFCPGIGVVLVTDVVLGNVPVETLTEFSLPGADGGL